MLLRLSLFIFVLFVVLPTADAQQHPTDYFRSPLEIPLLLSGNFGELRSNHFHSGIDIKTQGVEGQKVLAAAEGYVSRIKVSPRGYGKALYIRHPNGYTTVYAHLQKYSDKIEAYVKAAQYKKERFAIELFPEAGSIRVSKGELVAYSGNSGGSGGPHLHFEVRNTQNEHPIDPMLFGFNIKDNVSPSIRAVTIYPLNDSSYVNGKNSKKRIPAIKRNGKYLLNQREELKVYGLIGFGIEAIDRMDGTSNRYGLKTINLQLDSTTIYHQHIDEFGFDEWRYINAHIDYAEKVKSGRKIEQCYVDDNNRFSTYSQLKNRGKTLLTDEKKHNVQFTVNDLKGNESALAFEVLSEKPDEALMAASSTVGPKTHYFPYNRRNTLLKENILIDIPEGVLYENLHFEYHEADTFMGAFTPTYWLHKANVPLHKHMNVSIKLNDFPQRLKKHALIVSTTNGRDRYAEGGKWVGDNLSVRTRSFGGYFVMVDTIAPKITPINIYQGAQMAKKWSISFKIEDNLSGIGYFRGEVDGKWILMEYDPKRKLLYHYFDGRIEAGAHRLELTVRDKSGNSRKFVADFRR